MKTKRINLKYHSAERFCKDYKQFIKGQIFLPAKTPLAVDTELSLNISIPEIDQIFVVEGTVKKHIDRQFDDRTGKVPGMLIDLNEGADWFQKDLNAFIFDNPEYRLILGLSDPTASSQQIACEERASGIVQNITITVDDDEMTDLLKGIDLALDHGQKDIVAQKETFGKEESGNHVVEGGFVAAMKMAEDVKTHLQNYVNRILHIGSRDDAFDLIERFRKIMPVLVGQNDWQVVHTITEAVSKVGKENELFYKDADLPLIPQKFIFQDLTNELYEAYEISDEISRQLIDEIIEHLGSQGLDILTNILTESDERSARKAAVNLLIKKGDVALPWVLKVIDDPKQPWYLQRNALMILRHIGKEESEIDRARKLIGHSHPRVRDEALHAAITLKASDAEQMVIDAINDPDDKVRWRAASALACIAPLTEASIQKILDIIKSEPPGEKTEDIKHAHKISLLISTLGILPDVHSYPQVEEAILDIAQRILDEKKGFFKRIWKSKDSTQNTILPAVITALESIGTEKSKAFLGKLIDGSPDCRAKLRRTRIDRRCYDSNIVFPDRRSGLDRRSVTDRRKAPSE